MQEGTTGNDDVSAIIGGWVDDSRPECTQRLIFTTAGGFVHQARVTLDGAHAFSSVTGSWSGPGTAGAQVGAATTIIPQPATIPDRLIYCRQWLDAARVTLPFAQVAIDTGVDPLALIWRALPVPRHGRLLLGSDGTDTDRFALFLDDTGLLRGFVPTTDPAPRPYHREPIERIPTYPLTPTLQLVHLPDQTFRKEYPPATAGQRLDRRLLRITSASDVTFSAAPGSAAPICTLELYTDLGFLTLEIPNPLAPANLGQPVTLNPADPAQGFFVTTFTFADGVDPVYLWPVAIVAPTANGCSINIRARPIALRLLEERLVLDPAEDPIALAVGGGPAFITTLRAETPGQRSPVNLREGGAAPAWHGMTLMAQVIKPALPGSGPPASIQDILGLYDTGEALAYLTLTGTGSAARLNLFPDPSATYGLGPFRPYAPGGEDAVPPTSLQFPFSSTESFGPGETTLRYRFNLGAPTRVELWTSGGLDTAALLRDSLGRITAMDRDGATDGVGFYLVRTLGAGRYSLEVEREGVNGTFTLHGDLPGPGIPSDERLEACLIAAGSLRLSVGLVRKVACLHQGVADLTGIGTFNGLTHLDLSGNRLSDFTPLQSLTKLHTLSLGGNPIGDLSPLTSLIALRHLSLAHAILSATQVAFLATLGDALTHLDLTGVQGLSEADAAALKASLPNTTLTTPAGTVLD